MVSDINIFQVINENDLSQIVDNSQDKLVVVMFTNYTSFDKVLSYKLKKAFFDVSKAYITNIFIYVDLNNFDGNPERFTQDLKIPRFCFYFNKDPLGNVQGLNLNIFVQQLDFINSKLEEIKNIKISENKSNMNTENIENTNNTNNTSNTSNTSNNINNQTKLVNNIKLTYEDQKISPAELKNIVTIKKKIDEKGGHSSLSELILSHVVQRESGAIKVNSNQNNNKDEENNDAIDFNQMEQLKRLQILNATKNQVQMKLMNQIMFLKKLKQRKEIEELREQKREEEERERLEKEEKKREEDEMKKEQHRLKQLEKKSKKHKSNKK
uniref:Thioredoxin domain-containing protein n=1 Tax=viral metagenome TaxID=1070528 RepID=A0A6C0ABW2_9ZZZZ